MPAAANARKRKQTEEMESPLSKRVTRARSTRATKEVAEDDSDAQPKIATTRRRAAAIKASITKTTKITTGSVKAVASAKSAPKTAVTNRTVAKRRMPEHDSVDSADELERMDQPALTKKPRGRPRNDAPDTDASIVVEKTGASSKTASSARTIAATTKASASTSTDTKEAGSRVVGRKTRPTRATANSNRKKVTFDEGATNDKENVPLKTRSKSATMKVGSCKKNSSDRATEKTSPTKASISKTTGKSSARAQKATTTRNERVENGRPGTPLSPKKVGQVAKSVSSDSEDELCDGSPVRTLSKSPRKGPIGTHSVIHVSASTESRPSSPKSPSKSSQGSSLMSPAKRPPPSPFKDAIKQSPLKANLPPSPSKAANITFQPQLQSSMLASPKKIHLLPVSDGGPISPRRSPTKVSLFSPPKRPLSPEKSLPQPTPTTNATKTRSTAPVPQHGLPTITPRRLFITPPLEVSEEVSDEVPSIEVPQQLPIRQDSPAKVAFVQYNTNPLDAYTAELVQQGRMHISRVPRHHATNFHDDSDNECEVSTLDPHDNGTPTFVFNPARDDSCHRETLGITPLALKMRSWCPLENAGDDAVNELSPPSPFPASSELQATDNASAEEVAATGTKTTSFFEEGLEAQTSCVESPQSELTGNNEEMKYVSARDCRISQAAPDNRIETVSTVVAESSDASTPEKQDFEVHGDENTIPIDPQLLEVSPSHCFSPVAVTPPPPPVYRQREVHTVSKVPLRMEGPDASPLKIPRKRSKSINAPLSDLTEQTLRTESDGNGLVDDDLATANRRPLKKGPQMAAVTSPRKVSYETSIINAMMTPSAGAKPVSPVKSIRVGSDARILCGAVIYVDVHTSEGADASSIFVDLLTQMGARCVKQWTWNTRQSAAAANTPCRRDAASSNKVGITHVVFKDGGKRTLQKVREAKGLVLCVGVSWVLDCERENKWLDEATYACDTSTIPRGGHNRRKSMEPKMVSNQGGMLIANTTPAKGAYEVSSPTADFRPFSAASRRSSIRVSPMVEYDGGQADHSLRPPCTPAPRGRDGDETFDLISWTNGGASPTTPYYLQKGVEILQQTCPPKTLGERLFPVSGQIDDQPDEGMRQRLLAARRKSLQWAPKIQSPLGRSVSYGRQ